jgi:hypothetical protein
MEDEKTVEEMRVKVKRVSSFRRSFMSPGELYSIRTKVLRVMLKTLSEQLVSPSTGEPCDASTLYRWEMGQRPVPLWVARRVRDLAEAAKKYDKYDAVKR